MMDKIPFIIISLAAIALLPPILAGIVVVYCLWCMFDISDLIEKKKSYKIGEEFLKEIKKNDTSTK